MQLDAIPTPISTARLQLRPFTWDDLPAYTACHHSDAAYRYLHRPLPKLDALAAQFDALLTAPFAQTGDQYHLAVARQQDGVVVGQVLFKLNNLDASQLELGYIFNTAHTGHGYATEAAQAMLALGFGHIGAHRIFARIDARNTASTAVAGRLGLRQEAHLRHNSREGGEWCDELIYALLRSEWQARAGEQ